MSKMSPSEYKEWLEKQSLSTINHERVRALSFMYRYEEDKAASQNIDASTSQRDAYEDAKKRLQIIREVAATKKQNQEK